MLPASGNIVFWTTLLDFYHSTLDCLENVIYKGKYISITPDIF